MHHIVEPGYQRRRRGGRVRSPGPELAARDLCSFAAILAFPDGRCADRYQRHLAGTKDALLLTKRGTHTSPHNIKVPRGYDDSITDCDLGGGATALESGFRG